MWARAAAAGLRLCWHPGPQPGLREVKCCPAALTAAGCPQCEQLPGIVPGLAPAAALCRGNIAAAQRDWSSGLERGGLQSFKCAQAQGQSPSSATQCHSAPRAARSHGRPRGCPTPQKSALVGRSNGEEEPRASLELQCVPGVRPPPPPGSAWPPSRTRRNIVAAQSHSGCQAVNSIKGDKNNKGNGEVAWHSPSAWHHPQQGLAAETVPSPHGKQGGGEGGWVAKGGGAPIPQLPLSGEVRFSGLRATCGDPPGEGEGPLGSWHRPSRTRRGPKGHGTDQGAAHGAQRGRRGKPSAGPGAGADQAQGPYSASHPPGPTTTPRPTDSSCGAEGGGPGPYRRSAPARPRAAAPGTAATPPCRPHGHVTRRRMMTHTQRGTRLAEAMRRPVAVYWRQ